MRFLFLKAYSENNTKRNGIAQTKGSERMIGKITVQEAAAVLHVSQQFVRIGMQERVLPIGTALKMSSKWTYNITEGKLAEYAGVDLEEEIARIRGEGITA